MLKASFVGIFAEQDFVSRITVKPTSSTARTQKTVVLSLNQAVEIEIKGGHDPAIPPRIVPVAEEMVALVLADHLLRDRMTRV